MKTTVCVTDPCFFVIRHLSILASSIGGLFASIRRLIWERYIPSWSFPPPRHRTPDSKDTRGSCKLTGMQTDTETHGCVGKLLGRQRDKLERAEKAKADRK